LRTFSAQADTLIQADSDGGFRECSVLLENICRDGAFTDLVNYELDCLLHDDNYVLDASTDSDMLVWRSPFFTLLLKLVTEPQRKDRLFGQPFSHILVPINPRGVRLNRYHQPQPQPNDVFDRTRHLVFKCEETIAFGQSTYFKAGEDIAMLHVDPEPEAPYLLVYLLSLDKLPIRWEYDSSTLAPVRAVASETADSRLEFWALMVSAMDSRTSLAALEGLRAHPAHFVRWAAVQAIYRLDHAKGLEALWSALDDPHEHVRNAARHALTRIGPAAALSSLT
jgi:hypothetical protein